jgi:hypothetical protein
MDIKYKPTLDLEPDEEVGTRSYINALVNQNITFAKRLTTPYYGSQPEEGFSLSSDKSKEILDRYNVPAEEYADYLDMSSTVELENKLKYKQSSKQEAEIIANSGVGGIAASFVVGALDPVGWAIGGAAGKTAQLASKAYNLSSKGIRYSQAAAGSVGAIGSAGALEYSLDGELSDEALAINAILGFGIGFGTAGGMLNKSVVDGLENTAQYGVEASPYKKVDLMLEWMHSSAERAKASDNPLMRELGYKTSRSMKDVGLQGDNVANDMLSDYNQILNNYKENFDNLKTDYKKKYGKDFTADDERELIRVLHEIDNEHTLYKDNIYNEQLNKIRQEKAIEIENKYNEEYAAIDKKYSDTKYKSIGIHTSTYDKIGDIPKDAEQYIGNVAGNKATYVDTDGRWHLGEHGFDMSDRQFVHKVETTLDNPLIINDDTIDDIYINFFKDNNEIGKRGSNVFDSELFKDYIEKKGYDGIVIDLKKDIDSLPDGMTRDDYLFNPELKEEASDFNARFEKYSDGFDSLLQNQAIVFNPKKAIKTLETISGKKLSEKEISAMNLGRSIEKSKKASLEKTKLTKKKNKEIKKLESYKPDDAKLKDINAMTKEQGSKNIDNIINSKNEKLIPFIREHQSMTKKYGDELIKHDLHGMKDDIDNSWYATRAFDADKIDANKEGAVEAFKQGLASNLKEVDDNIMVELEKYARDIVDNITTAKADYNAFDADLNVIKKAIGKTKIKTGALKGRKLKIDASKLIDFMQDDIIHTASAYSRRVGGELALKRSLGIDDINTIEKVIKDKQITGKDKELLADMVERIKGTSEIDPNSNSVGSRIVRGFNQLNYINFGGWFGVNTMTDLSNIVNDFGLSRTMKYATNDIITALSKGDARQSKRLARTLGLAAESLTNDRAILMGGESFGQGKHFLGEKQLSWMSNKMSQLSGMNMTIDFMDRVVSMSSLDYIMTGNMRDTKFQKTMNRLGLSSKEISAIRKSGVANVKADGLHNVNLDKLDIELRANLERAIKRAARDTVLRANEIDSPKFLTEILGSKSLAKALFQFMRFPTVAYNKLGIKMKENWDTADAAVATIVAASILTLTNQAKDIGKDKPRYDLSTKEGIKNNTIAVVERLPHMSVVAMPQSYVDILGRLGSAAIGEDYKGRPSVNTGITMDRISDVATTGGNLLSFKPKTSDILTAASFTPFGNLFYLQAFNNMARDEIKDTKPVHKSKLTKDDIERYLNEERN